VVAYYGALHGRFPDVRSLADAPVDEVLHLWSGWVITRGAQPASRGGAHPR